MYKLLLIGVLLAPLLFLVFYSIPAFFLTAPAEKAPWISWYDDPHQRVYVSWETEEATLGIVQYGSNYRTNLTLSVTETVAKTIHHVNLTGLIANTKYYYQVVIDGEIFGSGEFKTAPTTYESFVFGMISDTQQNFGPGFHDRVAAVLATKEDYAFIANVGDIVEEGNEKPYYDDFFRVATQYLDTIPFVPILGNHDDHNPSIFSTYFKNSIGESEDVFYYSFNWSSVHFQICYFPYGRTSELTAAQEAWIKQDLANAQDMPFRITMFHCPIVGSSFFNNNQFLIDNVLPILEEYNVTATIHGHEHHFERGQYQNSNMIYYILGGGGGFLDPGMLPSPETQIITSTPCYTEVYATATLLNFKTYTLQNSLIDDYIVHAEGGA